MADKAARHEQSLMNPWSNGSMLERVGLSKFEAQFIPRGQDIFLGIEANMPE
jgi:hypothetical protein